MSKRSRLKAAATDSLLETTDRIYAEMTDLIASWEEERFTKREREIRLKLQPRPWWLPESVWRRVIARLLYIEEDA